MNMTLSPEAVEMFREELARQAAEIAQAKCFTATEAMEAFGITRAILKHIPRTMLPGRTKPVYSARAVRAYLAAREKAPETQARSKKP
jgi:hypothetical protein